MLLLVGYIADIVVGIHHLVDPRSACMLAACEVDFVHFTWRFLQVKLRAVVSLVDRSKLVQPTSRLTILGMIAESPCYKVGLP